jgi:hypothetical protein
MERPAVESARTVAAPGRRPRKAQRAHAGRSTTSSALHCCAVARVSRVRGAKRGARAHEILCIRNRGRRGWMLNAQCSKSLYVWYDAPAAAREYLGRSADSAAYCSNNQR